MGEILFEVRIPGRVRIKKNSRRVFRSGVNIPSAKYMAWEKGAGLFLRQAKLRWLKNLPIIEPCRAEFEFHFLNKKSECDTSNCIEGPQDLLQLVGVLENDRLITELEARKVFGIDECVKVRLLRIA